MPGSDYVGGVGGSYGGAGFSGGGGGGGGASVIFVNGIAKAVAAGGGGGGGGGQFSAGQPNQGKAGTLGVTAGGNGQGRGSGDGAGGGGGGAGQSSFVLAWSTLDLLSTAGYYRVTNPNYGAFLNTFGVWNVASSSGFDRTIIINFPSSGYYTVSGSCDNYGVLLFDGVQILEIGGFAGDPNISQFYATGGNHSVRLIGVNFGGPAAYGATITGGGGGLGGAYLAGDNGGYSGENGSSFAPGGGTISGGTSPGGNGGQPNQIGGPGIITISYYS
jgi:hypothetical protein